MVPALSGRWIVEELEKGKDYTGDAQYTMVAVPQGEKAGVVECLVVCLQSNDSDADNARFSKIGIGHASVSCEPGTPHTLPPEP